MNNSQVGFSDFSFSNSGFSFLLVYQPNFEIELVPVYRSSVASDFFFSPVALVHHFQGYKFKLEKLGQTIIVVWFQVAVDRVQQLGSDGWCHFH
jgi:hypothetical protein